MAGFDDRVAPNYVCGQPTSFVYEAMMAFNKIGCYTAEDVRSIASTSIWKQLELQYLKRRADNAQKAYEEMQAKITREVIDIV